ncbi:MAG: signal peptidase II [Candidatus Binataceae bacterium]
MRPVAPQAPASTAGGVSAAADWRRFGTMLGLVALPVFVLDQLVKLYIIGHLKLFEQIDLVPHWLAITYTLNSGAAFSLFATLAPAVREIMLDGLAATAVVVLGVLLARGTRPRVVSAAFALIMGGAAGNLLDRVVRGRVVDFIYVHYYAWSYPVFNIADSAITIGVAIILIHSVFFHDAEA